MKGFYNFIGADWQNVLTRENPAIALVSAFQATDEGYLKADVAEEEPEKLVSLPVPVRGKMKAISIWTLKSLMHLLLNVDQPLALAHGKSINHVV